MSRRRFLRIGALGLPGLTLARWLQARAEGETSPHAQADAVIQVYLGGGPSHVDLFDPKPDAPSEYRGEFQSLETRVVGLRFSELLTQLSKVADRLAVVRSLHHTTSDHAEGSHWILTGHPPRRSTPRSNERPSTGSVVAILKGARRPGLPGYVTLPEPPAFGYSAYLGPSGNPFSPLGDLAAGLVQLPNLELPQGVALERLEDRRHLLSRLDRVNRERDATGTMRGLDRFKAEAYAMITGSAARLAFDLSQEPEPLRDRYGRSSVGQGCLLARRLVEAGVRFVTLAEGGWDHHGQVFSACRKQVPPLDQALGTLIADLQDRGLADRVLLLVWGEFGRTPRVNGQAGRDHWPGAFSGILSGGGIRPGVVVGSTDRKGEGPTERPLTPADLIQTVYRAIGIDPRQTLQDETGRPLPLLDGGAPIAELV
ncbi:MAG: DUF1501 domain-containing protein [Isosphaeraceae bacterium]